MFDLILVPIFQYVLVPIGCFVGILLLFPELWLALVDRIISGKDPLEADGEPLSRSTDSKELPGKVAVVQVEFAPRDTDNRKYGRVTINSESWHAVFESQSGPPPPVGEEVRIVAVDGITLTVRNIGPAEFDPS